MVKTDSIAKKLLSKLLPAPLVLGVEVSEYSIKMVLIRQEPPDSVSLLDYAIIPLAAKVVSGKLSPVSIIKNILKEKRLFTARQAKLVISGPELDCKRITLPFMPKKEIAEALRLKAKDYFPFGIEESVLDFEVLEEATAKEGTRNIEVMASLAKKTLIEEKLSFFKDTRIPPSVVIPTAYGLSNLYSLHKEKKSDQPVALIDIGAATTTVAIMNNNKVSFFKQLGCAGKDFTEAMTEASESGKDKKKLSPEEAEELKIQIGIPGEPAQQIKEGISAQQINSMLKPILDRLADEIKRSFEYYTSQFNEGRVKKVIISGGTSKMKNIHAHLSHGLKDVYPQISQTLSIPVESLKIPQALKIDLIAERADSFKEDFPVLVPAIGAALSSPQDINLIPPAYKRLKIKRIKKLSIRLIFIIISLTLLISYLFNCTQERLLRNLLAVKQPQWQKLQEIEKLHSATAQKDTIIKPTLKNQASLYYIFKALSNLTPEAVYLESLIIKDKAGSLKMEGVILETAEIARVTLDAFIKALEDSVFFNDVNLVSSQDTVISNKQALKFEISCKL